MGPVPSIDIWPLYTISPCSLQGLAHIFAWYAVVWSTLDILDHAEP